jgi:arylsulfatase A-like enzyme
VRASIWWLLLWLSLLIGVVGCQPAIEPPPNIIVISIDTLNRDALRAFARDTPPLPVLDAFAEESIRFVNAYSTASWTLPAHASLLTGLYPDRHGATRETLAMVGGASTVAEALRSMGYQTIALVGGGYLNARYGFSRGFERYDDEPVRGVDLFGRAIDFISQRPVDAAPLFLFLHTYTVHQYFAVRDWAVARLGEGVEIDGSGFLGCLSGRRQCAPQDWNRMRALYRAEVEHLDEGFGRLVAALEEAELWDRSVVFFLSDHGEGFDVEHRRIHHGGRLHADLLQIPMLARVPDQAPRDETTPVSLVDLMPTILELTGAAPIADLDGRSFAAALRGEPLAPDARPLYAMEHNYSWNEKGERGIIQGPGRHPTASAVIDGRHWYIRNLWTDELYDMETDRSQRRNLAPEADDLDSYRRLLAERSRWRAVAKPIEPDEELLEQLRSLGYAR